MILSGIGEILGEFVFVGVAEVVAVKMSTMTRAMLKMAFVPLGCPIMCCSLESFSEISKSGNWRRERIQSAH